MRPVAITGAFMLVVFLSAAADDTGEIVIGM